MTQELLGSFSKVYAIVEDSNIPLCPRTRGPSAINVEIQTSTQAWKLIEQDYTLRLSLVAHEWATEHLGAWNAVFAEGRRRKNSCYFGPALVEMEIADADRRAEWVFRTCCDIWEVQGRTKCRPFFRAVFEALLQPMFSMREGSISHQLELQERRTGASIPQGLSVIAGDLNRKMSGLRAKWNTKLEIATRDNEYQQRRARSQIAQQGNAPTVPLKVEPTGHLGHIPRNIAVNGTLYSSSPPMQVEQVHAVALSFTWKELEKRFREIQSKPPLREILSANFTRTEWDSGAVTEEWTMGGNLACQSEFERLASIAARKLSYASSEDASKYWLERLRVWLRSSGLDRDSDLTWRPTGSGISFGAHYKTSHLSSERIAELSAMFCMELIAQGVRESVIAPPSERGIPNGQSKRDRARPTKRQTKSELVRTAVIFGALQTGLKAFKYCAALDGRGVRVPNPWVEEDCPSTYPQAYKDPKWRKRIQDEKSRYNRRYEAMSPQEREAVIQAKNGTRRTRR